MFSPSTRGTCIVVLFVATLCSGMGKLILQEVEWILCAWLLSFFYGLIYSFQENFDSGWCLLKFPVQRTNTTFAVVPVVANWCKMTSAKVARVWEVSVHSELYSALTRLYSEANHTRVLFSCSFEDENACKWKASHIETEGAQRFLNARNDGLG